LNPRLKGLAAHNVRLRGRRSGWIGTRAGGSCGGSQPAFRRGFNRWPASACISVIC